METLEQKQIREDNEMIPNPGDVRIIKQQGKINLHSLDFGDRGIPAESHNVEIEVERKRNEQGNVDVTIKVPVLDLRGEAQPIGG